MKSYPRATWTAVLIALVVGTGIHVFYRIRHHLQRTDPNVVAGIPVGDVLPNFRLTSATGSAATLPEAPDCWVLVVFSPECPHCRVAAERDASQSNEQRYPLLWVGNGSPASVDSFAHALSAPLTVLASPDVRSLLQVRAVPAAFLIGADHRVRLVFPYRGGIAKTRLQGYCGTPHA